MRLARSKEWMPSLQGVSRQACWNALARTVLPIWRSSADRTRTRCSLTLWNTVCYGHDAHARPTAVKMAPVSNTQSSNKNCAGAGAGRGGRNTSPACVPKTPGHLMKTTFVNSRTMLDLSLFHSTHFHTINLGTQPHFSPCATASRLISEGVFPGRGGDLVKDFF